MLAYRTDPSLPSVPRSKGCLTCVKRKTRCDGRRPTCFACENRKQVCGGYRRNEFVFLNEGWRSLGVASEPRRNTNRRRINTKNSSANRSALTNPEPTIPTTFSESTDLSLDSSVLSLCSSPKIDRSHLHIAYFLHSFGTRPGQALASLGHLFRHYIPMALSKGSSNVNGFRSCSSATPVVFAVDALAYCHFGTANADQISVQRSFHEYGMALQYMSTRLHEMQRVGSSFNDISDEDWQHFAFFCLVMAFWEMKMSPVSRNWEKHLRSLAASILLRGADHLYSRSNSQLLASSRLLLMLQTLSVGEPNDWQQRSPIRFAWLTEVKLALGETQDPNASSDYELYLSIDALMADVTIIVSTASQFDQLLSQGSTAMGLVTLYEQMEIILSQQEARLARWKRNVSEISLSSWLSLHPDMATDPVSNAFWTSMNDPDVRPCFDTVLTFSTMLEYHSLTLYWTITMSLRLVLSDMLIYVISTGMDGIPASSAGKVEDHRVQLMDYAINVLRTICYAIDTENRAIGPFVFATAFQLAIAVLEREHGFLQTNPGDNRDKVQKCDSLKGLAVRYLDWAMQNKIPVKIDLSSLRRLGIRL